MAEEVDKILRITRHKAELGDVPFVTFTVHRSSKDKKVLCGHYKFDYRSFDKRFKFNVTPIRGFQAVVWRR
jgi:hypothetical protein